jgi:phosphonopyruvate decarboxylase
VERTGTDSRNFNVVGCMGSAAAVALGLAIARPHERVLALDGDGSLLMQLGSLVSVGECAPRNLYHVVFENGIYETSGGNRCRGDE